MSLSQFINEIKSNNPVSLDETIAVITENYHYQPTEFSNGLDTNTVINAAGINEGSCKIFAFAQINQLTQQQTLNLFGDFYRKDVLGNLAGEGHQNIRNFIHSGWKGIDFSGQALILKK